MNFVVILSLTSTADYVDDATHYSITVLHVATVLVDY